MDKSEKVDNPRRKLEKENVYLKQLVAELKEKDKLKFNSIRQREGTALKASIAKSQNACQNMRNGMDELEFVAMSQKESELPEESPANSEKEEHQGDSERQLAESDQVEQQHGHYHKGIGLSDKHSP